MGGNSYFGIKLVKRLLQKDYSVTILNRGNKEDPFADKVTRIKCDRFDRDALRSAIKTGYDVVFDQCCFDYDQAKLACEVFNGKVGRYIFTSSISAYNQYGSMIKEEVHDTKNYSYEKKVTLEEDYGEAKRQAETAFYRYADFPVVSARLPIVLDKEDATNRLQYHINRIKNGQEIFFNNLDAEMSFIKASDAAKALFKLSLTNFSGPINVASEDPISLRAFMNVIEEKMGKKLLLANEKSEENNSPYGVQENWTVDTSLLRSLKIDLDRTHSYLPTMI